MEINVKEDFFSKGLLWHGRALQKIGLLIVGLLTTSSLFAQFYYSGEDPARLKWNQIQVNNFQLIYPRGIDSVAFRYAYLFEKAAPYSMKGLNVSGPKMPIVLHPYTTEANGMVVWTPKRMELYTMYAPDNIGTSWEKSLVVHEARHVAQMQRSGDNLFRALHYLIGEQSEGLSIGLVFSSALLEGDAVLTETGFSSGGRGRQSEFLMPYKTLFADKKYYSFDKFLMGSYKHEIPNQYAFGYMQLSTGRYLNEKGWKNSEQALSTLFYDVTRHPLLYHGSFKKQYGYSRVELWKKAQEWYTELWAEEAKRKAPFDDPKIISFPEKSYVSYRDLTMLDSSIYAVKSSMSEGDNLVRLRPNRKPKRLTWLGNINSLLSVEGQHIYWTESVSGLRWAHENYSVLKEYNVLTRKVRTLTPKSYYFHPTPYDENTMALATYFPEGGSQLVVFDVAKSLIKTRIEIPDHAQLGEMIWIDQSTLFAILNKDGGSGIFSINIVTKEWKEVLPVQHYAIHSMDYREGNLYYGSDMDGTDNLYRLEMASGKTWRVTNIRFGGFDYLIDGEKLYLSNYSRKGYEVGVLDWLDLSERPFSPEQQSTAAIQTIADRFSAEADFNIDTLAIPAQLSYPVEKYSKISHLFNIHSWTPFYYDLDEIAQFTMSRYYESVAPGAMLMSQNALGTFTSQCGYSYHQGYHAGHLKMTYSGWYPVINLKVDYNDATAYQYRIIRDQVESKALGPECTTSLNTYIPFTFNKGGFSRGLIPSAQWSFSNNSYYSESRNQNEPYQYLQFGLHAYCLQDRAESNLFPRRGVGLTFQRITPLPFGKNLFTGINYLKGYAYFPGVGKNHAFHVDVAYQEHTASSATRLFSGNFINLPLGYRSSNVKMFSALSLLCQYAFPINLDISLPSLLYIKRMQCIPFFNGLSYITDNPDDFSKKMKKQLSSSGLEMLFDVNILRLSSLEFTAGLRFSRLDRSYRTEFVLSVPYL